MCGGSLYASLDAVWACITQLAFLSLTPPVKGSFPLTSSFWGPPPWGDALSNVALVTSVYSVST